MASDFDSPWKEALDRYFEAFLMLLFPQVHALIDWARAYESLDKEFQQVVREADVGRRYVDKLVKVWTKDGQECWVLVHIEVQTTRDEGFPKRMYVYNYRVFDRYNRAVASLAVLADDDPDWRPGEFWNSLFGCEAGLRFPAMKLLDFAAREAELEASDNPFARVVLAHLKAQQTRGDASDRYTWKKRLVRGLFERGFSAQDVRELFRLIDWLMELPPPLAKDFRDDVDKMQEEGHMPYVTSIERLAKCEGMCESIEEVLRHNYAEEGLKLLPDIQQVSEVERLRSILKALLAGESLDEVRRLCTPGSP